MTFKDVSKQTKEFFAFDKLIHDSMYHLIKKDEPVTIHAILSLIANDTNEMKLMKFGVYVGTLNKSQLRDMVITTRKKYEQKTLMLK